ncbi:MAG: PilN domain-containing protein [Acidobacteria bacterium]|nr:PilN domain-containing protein [Acidobacteriota bacterium]
MKPKADLQMEVNLRTKGWGLAINQDRLVLTAVRNRFNQIRFVASAVLEDLSQKSDEDVKQFIEDFMDEHRLKRGEAYLGMSQRDVQLQMVEFPLEAADSLDEVLEYQLENLFPGNYDQFDFFHQIVSRHEQLAVLVIAIRKEVLGAMYARINRWNLQLAGVTLESIGLTNGLTRLEGEAHATQKVAVFHFATEAIELTIIREGKLVLSERIRIAKETLHRDLMAGLEQAFSEARLDPNEVDKFFLSGAVDEEAEMMLRHQFGFRFDPLKDSLEKEIPPESVIGVCLAITAVFDKNPLQLNLLPQSLRKRHRHLPLLIASFVGVLVCVYLLYGEYTSYKKIDEELTFTLQQSERLKGRVEELSALQLEHETKSDAVKSFYKFRYSDSMALKLLSELTNALPDHTYLTSFSIRDGDQLTIQGESEEPFAVRSKLQSLPFLTDVDTKNAITPGRDPVKKKFTFGARIQLEALR